MTETEEERELRLSRAMWHRLAQKEHLKQIDFFNNRVYIDIPFKHKEFIKRLYDIRWDSSNKDRKSVV